MPHSSPDPAELQREETAPREPPWSKRLVAESFGTFALVFVAAGADTMASASGGQISPAARAVAPALMVAALIYAIGDSSGAHFNPAVSLAFALKRLFPPRWLVPYWIAQVVGAVTAAALLTVLFGDAAREGISRPHIGDSTALALEVVLTMLLVVVVLGTADRYRIVGPDAALAVGATIALCGLIALPIDGASMNPARSLGPALVGGDLTGYPIYLLGPIVGATLGALLTLFLHGIAAHDGKAEEAARGGQP